MQQQGAAELTQLIDTLRQAEDAWRQERARAQLLQDELDTVQGEMEQMQSQTRALRNNQAELEQDQVRYFSKAAFLIYQKIMILITLSKKNV